MPSSNNSNVYLEAEAQPQSVTATTPAIHSFKVENYNPWPAEVTDSVVSVVGGAGLDFDLGGGSRATAWSPGRLGILRHNGSTNPVNTTVCKVTGTYSAAEEVEVTVTFRRAPLPNRPQPSNAVALPVRVLVPIG